MNETNLNPLSDIGKMKENLILLLTNNTDVTKLADSCFDTPYIQENMADNDCAIFIETSLLKVANQRIKEVGVDINIVCHKDSITLSEDDKTHFNSIGIYGNRLDCAVQAIHSAIVTSDKNYSIGDLTFVEEEPIKQYNPGTDFFGKQMSYTYQAFYQKNNRSR